MTDRSKIFTLPNKGSKFSFFILAKQVNINLYKLLIMAYIPVKKLNGDRSIATGGLYFPVAVAGIIVINEIISFLSESQSIQQVVLVCFSTQIYEKYLQVFE